MSDRFVLYNKLTRHLGLFIAFMDSIYSRPEWRSDFVTLQAYLGSVSANDELLEVVFNILCFIIKDNDGDSKTHIRDGSLSGLLNLSGSSPVGIKAIYKIFSISLNDSNQYVRRSAKEVLEDALLLLV